MTAKKIVQEHVCQEAALEAALATAQAETQTAKNEVMRLNRMRRDQRITMTELVHALGLLEHEMSRP